MEADLDVVPLRSRQGVIVADGSIFEVNYTAAKVVGVVVDNSFIFVPDVEHNRWGIFEFIVVVVNFKSLKEDRVQVILDNLGLDFLAIRIEDRNVGVRSPVFIGARKIFSLENEATDLPRNQSLGRRQLPSIDGFEIEAFPIVHLA